jgi:UDP-N-acetylmuramyl pentapeptide phosphotransferase/UDP-N-acetylglucosamine-1-phosphate transferase
MASFHISASAILLAGLCSWLFLFFVIPLFSRFLLDIPSARSSHCHTTPRGGGLAFVLVASASSVIAFFLRSISSLESLTLLVAPLLALPLALVGLLDDRRSLPAFLRYCAQIATAFVLILASPLVAPSFSSLPLLTLFLIALTAVINFTNFMDGLDGLLAGCMAVALSTAAIRLAAPWPIWALVGALLGFLCWNWSPAKVFMGDVGSTFLGAVFALLVLQASNWSESLALLLVATPILGDACLCLPRRLMAGQDVFQAHRLHLFQRLYQAGWSHARVSSLYILSTAALAVSLLWGDLPWVIALAFLELLIGVWLDQQVAVPFSVASRN